MIFSNFPGGPVTSEHRESVYIGYRYYDAADIDVEFPFLTSATRSRIVPVAMASGTTILGMLPLLFDSMFGAMAATIMGGLLVATLLTVCVLPVVYALFYNIRKP